MNRDGRELEERMPASQKASARNDESVNIIVLHALLEMLLHKKNSSGYVEDIIEKGTNK